MAQYDPGLDPQLQNLPYSLEAEQSVLGGLLLDPESIGTVLEYITKPEMFYRRQHRELFSVLIGMFNAGKTIDFITVLEEAGRAEIFENSESAKTYLVQLMELVPTVANITEYCRIVREKYYIRSLMISCAQISEKAAESDVDAGQILDFAEQRIYDIRQGKDSTALSRVDTVIIEAYDKLLKL
ncbi:MAG: DnaB-like helicase N-terminal domain-containing protein, partial [Anaerotruncus rubiinfantis]